MECLNQNNEHNLEACLTKGDGYLESDCDEQVLNDSLKCGVNP